MQDQGERRVDRGRPPDASGDERPGDRQSRDEGGGGADTRFLQLEQSRVMFAEAEEVVRPAFRELLLEAAKEHLRQRFGEQITALARLAVDDLMTEVEANLEIEARISRHREERQPVHDRLRELLAGRRAGAGSPPEAGGRREAARSRRRRRGR